MIDMDKTGKQIALLRKEKGFTGERLAEILEVSAQAVSKWENGKCLPETSILPSLAKALSVSVDTLLMPKELLILDAVYTDGEMGINVTHIINNHITGNTLDITVNGNFLGASIQSVRLKLLTVKYQTANGVYFGFAVENERLYIDLNTLGEVNECNFKLIGAYYGNSVGFTSAMQKMQHYEFFKWDRINVNHEAFPSSTDSDETEYLTLVYLNKNGINTISCAENETLFYNGNRTELYIKDESSVILPRIIKLEWENGMDCPWAGALYASLKYMGENYTYEQIMGLSGACYRSCFTDVWDWSCTDALVSYDYSTIFFDAIGYEQIWADRLEKSERKAEREKIMRDLQNGKPVIAINLRIAPEWGVITGYLKNGNELLCRTYFDKSVFESPGYNESAETGGYIVNDFWPFLIVHFGEKKEKPHPLKSLMRSLETLCESFNAPQNRGYYQGRKAYAAWIKGLSDEAAFSEASGLENVKRRLEVNDSMLLCLIDARRCAGIYLNESISLLDGDKKPILEEIAGNYEAIYKMFYDFRSRAKLSSGSQIKYNGMEAYGAATPQLRREQIELLKKALELEEKNLMLAKSIINP